MLYKVKTCISIAIQISSCHIRKQNAKNKEKKKQKTISFSSPWVGVCITTADNLGWELRVLGLISWFCCCRESQNPSPSSSTQWTEDLGGSILHCFKQPAILAPIQMNILYMCKPYQWNPSDRLAQTHPWLVIKIEPVRMWNKYNRWRCHREQRLRKELKLTEMKHN